MPPQLPPAARRHVNERGALEDASGFRLAARLLLVYSTWFLWWQERSIGEGHSLRIRRQAAARGAASSPPRLPIPHRPTPLPAGLAAANAAYALALQGLAAGIHRWRAAYTRHREAVMLSAQLLQAGVLLLTRECPGGRAAGAGAAGGAW